MNINNITNRTLSKLTAQEIGNLDLCNYGVGLYRGDLKSRYNGMRRQTEDGITFTYEWANGRIEFTEIESAEEVREWAARIYNKERNEYETYPMGITGCQFFR